ncbi:hypothetical protein Desor_1597 [Desulfosporosinus orientis DSM 765]|uniref:Integral membrane protein n=1 Tax=Desulfosporosinus orientis (strain ATCC 19365 / DSM 765 / NCIMB 8382 / VKM B-1628 / Singapore I) TaxID=768706 RepID=G7WD49_DESOD|nr:hypothetical protein [Desulfosporosinus orientis]AET67244.1 hypothetical protein Desor_1597 [Desulfosporosinus orientis DSM 765]
MRNSFKLSLELLVLLSLLIFSPSYAFANELQTQIGGNPLVIPAGHSTETVITADTDARIAGTVTEAVIVINGNVYLESTAHVDLVIALGGHIYNSAVQPPQTGVFEFNFNQSFMNQLLLGIALLLGGWLIRFILSLMAIILLTVLGYLLNNRISKAKNILSVSSLRLFGIGAGLALIILCFLFLLILTVIGIPVAVVLFLLSFVAAILGLIPIIDYWGTKLLAPKVQDYPALTKWLIQALLFVALVNLPLIGFVFLLITGITGLGLLVTYGWIVIKSRRQKILK